MKKTLQTFLDKNVTPDRIKEVKKLFLETFKKTEKTYYNNVNAYPMKLKYLPFFANVLSTEKKYLVDDILNQPQ